MLICDKINLAFIQIPKSGSRAVKRALTDRFGVNYSLMADDLGVTVDQFKAAYNKGEAMHHPLISSANFDHLTLPYWKEFFPRTWQSFVDCSSFALVRDPRERFLSALMQRLGQYHGQRTIRADDMIVREEASHVCEWLAGRGGFIDKEYIHFTRQIDYVELDGQKMVNVVFPIERTDAVSRWLRLLTNQDVPMPPGYSRREPKKWARPILPPASFFGRNFLPLAWRKIAYPFWRNSGIFDDAAKRYSSVNLGTDVEAFIAEFYAADAALRATAQAEVQAFRTRADD